MQYVLLIYDDPTVFFLSIHRYGHGFYPGTGAAAETGTGPGLGANRNVPIHFATSRRDYHDQFADALAVAICHLHSRKVKALGGRSR